MTRGVPWLAFCVLASFLGTLPSLAQTGFLSPEPDCCTEAGVFLPCSATSAAEVASMRLRVQLPPVPAYPDNGEISEELRLRLVFLDVETGELVLSFPPGPDFEKLDPETAMENGRIKDRAPLRIATCPSLSVAIYPSGDPQSRGHVYHYRLHNRRQARQSIGWMVLPIPLTQETLPVRDLVAPYGWHVPHWDGPKEGEFLQRRLGAMTFSWGDAYRERMRRAMIRRRVRWFGVLSEIEPGNTLDTFMLTTEARPGIVRAYIQAGSDSDSHRMNWTEAIGEQLQPFHYIENNSLSIATIGPQYLPNMDRRRIASSFVNRLEDLIRNGEVSGESMFIQEVVQGLEAVVEGDGGAVDPAFWPAETATDFEAEVLMAIRLSLGE